MKGQSQAELKTDQLCASRDLPICFFPYEAMPKNVIVELVRMGWGRFSESGPVCKPPSRSMHKLISRCRLLTVKVVDTFQLNTVAFHEC